LHLRRKTSVRARVRSKRLIFPQVNRSIARRESRVVMDLYLSYAWMFAAVASACLWLRPGRRTLESRHIQFLGLFVFIVILFPVISVTDGLRSIHSPAETKTVQLNDEHAARALSVLPEFAPLPGRVAARLSFHPQRSGPLLHLPLLALDNPALDPLQNRPPPWA